MAISRFQNTDLFVFGLFMTIMAFLGGSSRPDAAQLLLLRPLSALFFAYALYHVSKTNVFTLRIPLVFLLGLTVIFLFQLIPLPPALWMSLPGRQEVADLGTVVGTTDLWRPLSLTPSRTANTMAAMLVPITALLFFAVQKQEHKHLFFLLVAGLALLSATLGLVQIVSGSDSALFFYNVTNKGSAVGFFANRNHNAVFLVIGLFAMLHYAWLSKDRTSKWSVLDLAVLCAAIVVFVIILVNGSRAGLVCLGIFMLCAALIFWQKNRLLRGKSVNARVKNGRLKRVFFPLVFGLFILSIAGLFFMTDRILALNRFLERDSFEDLRFQAFGVFSQLFDVFWITGSGFGSFEYVYRIYEPSSLLMPSYINQAHNDWIQFAIEGGLLAMFIFFLFAIWLIGRLVGMLKNPALDIRHFVFWVGVFVTIGTASLFDYPLRTPFFQMIGVWLVALFTLQSENVKE